ncbi:MAG: type VII secretion integral membrane protein EccD [Sporichthyaceae bacterium]
MTDTITDPSTDAAPDHDEDPDAGASPGPAPRPAHHGAALIRITVRSATQRVDLVVPGAVAVADLLPDLAAEVGVLDASTAHGGYRLVRGDGEELWADEGLSEQGIVDGDVLLVAAGVDDEVPRVYDDVVEAVADTVERVWRPWDAAAARWTALTAAAALLGVGAVALGLARDEGVPVYVGGYLAAVLLLAGGIVLAQARGEHQVGTVVAWLAAPYAAAAGLAVTPDEPVLRLPLALAGAGVFAVGVIGMLALSRTRFALLPPLVVGAAAGGCGGALAALDDARPGVAAAVVLVVAVIAGVLLPMFAVANTGLRPPQPQNNNDLVEDPEPLGPEDVEGRLRVGREMSLALSATVALLVILATPMVVDLGVGGAALAGAAAAALLLRTRQYRTYAEVAVGVGGGVGGAVALIVSAIVLHPDWRPTLAGIGAGVGVAVLLFAISPNRPPLRLGRAADAAESGALVALVPLAVIASGLLDVVNR